MVNKNWTKLDDKLLNKTRIFDLRAQRMRSPDGSYEDDFYYIQSPDWVNIIPITKNKEVVMVRQYRHGINQMSLETPGGLVDLGEDPRKTALRELKEETGYSSDNVIEIGSICPNPAMLTNKCYLYAAFDCELQTTQSLDAAEDISIHLLPFQEVVEQIARGEIVHTIVATAFFYLWRSRPELF